MSTAYAVFGEAGGWLPYSGTTNKALQIWPDSLAIVSTNGNTLAHTEGDTLFLAADANVPMAPIFGGDGKQGCIGLDFGDGSKSWIYQSATAGEFFIPAGTATTGYLMMGTSTGSEWANTLTATSYTINGNLTVNGSTFNLGNAATDNVNLVGTFNNGALTDTMSIAASADSIGRAMTGLTTSHFIKANAIIAGGTGSLAAPQAVTVMGKAHTGWVTIRTSAACTARTLFYVWAVKP